MSAAIDDFPLKGSAQRNKASGKATDPNNQVWILLRISHRLLKFLDACCVSLKDHSALHQKSGEDDFHAIGVNPLVVHVPHGRRTAGYTSKREGGARIDSGGDTFFHGATDGSHTVTNGFACVASISARAQLRACAGRPDKIEDHRLESPAETGPPRRGKRTDATKHPLRHRVRFRSFHTEHG